MFCVHCGNTYKDTNASYCSNCGKPASDVIPRTNGTPRRIPKGWAFWAIAIMFGLAWFSMLIFLFYIGHRPPTQVIISVLFWTACLVSYISNKGYGRGWIGFFGGLLLGIGALQVVSLIAVNIHGASN